MLKSLPQNVKKQDDANSEQLEHQRLTSLINSMADGVIAIDSNLIVRTYNAAVLDLLDRNTSIEGQPIHKVLRLLDKANVAVDIRDLISKARVPTINRDLLLRYDSDNSLINLYISIAPVHLGYGKVGDGGFVIVLRDISREKSLEEERDEFISVASHELRTPIAITEGNVSNALFIINKGGTTKEIVTALENTHKQIIFLTELVNDLTTLSRAERGTLPLDVGETNVNELIEELDDNYQTQLKAKGLSLKIDLDPRLELVNTSRLYLKEIVQNFITNAIKYTSLGGITISAYPKQNGVGIEVTDTGIGISKSDQTKVFAKFFRSEDYRTRLNNGTGLGLYVTSKLAKLIKAEITLTSKLNHGSSFLIYVPNLPSKPDKQTTP